MFSSVFITHLLRFFASAICCGNAFPLLQFNTKLLPFRSRRRFDAKLRYEKPTSFFLEQTIEQLSIFVLTFRIMLTPHLINKVPHSKRSIHGKALKSLYPSSPSIIIIRPLDLSRCVLCSLHSFFLYLSAFYTVLMYAYIQTKRKLTHTNTI